MTKTTPAVESQSQANPQSAEGEAVLSAYIGDRHFTVTCRPADALSKFGELVASALRTAPPPAPDEGEPTSRLRVGELDVKVTADTSEAIANLEILEERVLRTDARLRAVSGAGSLQGLLDTINTGVALLGVLVKASADTNAVTEATVASVASRMASLMEEAEKVARAA